MLTEIENNSRRILPPNIKTLAYFRPSFDGRNVERKVGASFVLKNLKHETFYRVIVTSINPEVVEAEITRNNDLTQEQSDPASVSFGAKSYGNIEHTDVVIKANPVRNHPNRALFVLHAPVYWRIVKESAPQSSID